MHLFKLLFADMILLFLMLYQDKSYLEANQEIWRKSRKE